MNMDYWSYIAIWSGTITIIACITLLFAKLLIRFLDESINDSQSSASKVKT